MKRLVKTFLVIAVTLSSWATSSPAYSASVNCTKLNEIKTIQKKDYVCVKQKGKLSLKPIKVALPAISFQDFYLIPDGFSMQVSNFETFNPSIKWTASTKFGDASIDENGTINVTGNLMVDDVLEVRASNGKYFRIATYSGEGFLQGTIQVPQFAPTSTLTLDGFKILITNYDSEKTWSATSSVGDVDIESSGLLVVSNVFAPGVISIQIDVRADGFRSISKTFTYVMPEITPAPEVTFSSATTSSLKFEITNFNPSFNWTVSSSAGNATLSNSGSVLVTNLQPNQSATITVNVVKAGAQATKATKTGTTLPLFSNISDRDWALIAKDPQGNIGKSIVIYGYITQFDAATGLDQFRADVNGINSRNSYGLSGDNTFLYGNSSLLKNFVAKDYFTAKVIVRGTKTYTTTLNGNITVPLLEIYEISRT